MLAPYVVPFQCMEPPRLRLCSHGYNVQQSTYHHWQCEVDRLELEQLEQSSACSIGVPLRPAFFALWWRPILDRLPWAGGFQPRPIFLDEGHPDDTRHNRQPSTPGYVISIIPKDATF